MTAAPHRTELNVAPILADDTATSRRESWKRRPQDKDEATLSHSQWKSQRLEWS